MIGKRGSLRVGASVFRWAMVALLLVAWFFWTAAAVESDWIEGLADDGAGALVAAGMLAGPLLVVLLVVMLRRYRGERPAAIAGWAASLPLFAGLFLLGHGLLGNP